ncbi:MAG TPA: OmpH family outer membrane protein [Dysgonamonadaceae bacterium]|nr:OmpH family outer membrane protein [Dysgonamonadaceae bacterium]
MKNTYSYVIGGIIAVAVVVLYILFFTSRTSLNSDKNGAAFNLSDSTVTLPIAYVNIDSLLSNYNFAKDLNEALIRKEESSRATLNQKQREMQTAAQEFERKRQNNAFLSQDRAQQEYDRIMRMQQEYEQTANRLSQEFALEQQKLNFQMEDTIKVRLEEFNKNKKYEIIFSNRGTGTILYSDKKYDITKEVIDFLNKKYGPATASSSSNEKKE